MDLKSKIILISGPTASGKSKLAINFAKKINGPNPIIKTKVIKINVINPIKKDFTVCIIKS